MKLYNADLSPNALRVRAVSFELGINLEIINVDLRSGENKAPEYLALNPNGKVPVLVDGDFVLWESRAIMSYLASLRPENALYPDDAKKRAIVDQWSYWQAIHLGPAIQRVSFERVMKPKFGIGEPDEAAIQTHLKEIGQFLPVLDANLADKDWVCGDLSIAEFSMGSTFMYRRGAGILLDATPHVAKWIGRLEARPSWQKAVAQLSAMFET
jgi:glutathione S-transferase